MNKYLSSKFAPLVLILVLALCYGYPRMFGYGPYSKHMWRQADGLSITLNYYKEGMKFHSPKIHSQLSNKGKGIAEFPILYYANAFIWKLVGQSEGTYRLFNILILFLGLFHLFKTSKLLDLNNIHALLITAFAFTSPVLVFYGSSFLPNAPALAIAVMGIYYYLKANKNDNLLNLSYAFVLFTLAILLRFSLVLFLIPFYLHFAYESFKVFKMNRFRSITHLILPLTSAVICGAWLIGVKWYNETNDSWYFLTTLRPIWELSNLEISGIFDQFWENVLPELYQPIVLGLLLVIGLVITFIKVDRTFRLLKLFGVYQLIISLTYMILWYKNFNVHDYYLLEILFFPIAIFISIIYFIQNKIDSKPILTNITVLFVLFSLSYSISLHRLKYFEGDKIGRHSPLINQKTKDLWNWWHWNYRTHFKAYEEIQPYLRSLGISRYDKVISFPDQSPNISLYLMDQKGFTDLFKSHETRTNKIKEAIALGAKYLIINKDEVLNELENTSYLNQPIGQFENIRIFKLTGS